MSDRQLRGLRVLLIEDEELVAELIIDILDSAGCVVQGPFGRLPDALEAAQSDNFDAAVLDLDLGGTPTFPVAALLDKRHVPFCFLTGFGKGGVPAEYATRPVVPKPFKAQQLLDTLQHDCVRHIPG